MTDSQKKKILNTFKKAAREVPAYRDFLKKHKINPSNVKTWSDFEKIPWTSKKNYFNKYPLNETAWRGKLDKPLVYTSTSGSTGKPTYFARSENLDYEYSVLIEDYLSRSGKKPVLVIIGFGMGVWIGGLITYKAFEMASRRNNLPVSVITTGVNKEEIFKALATLSPKYAQTILVGYPPFVKDIVDEAEERKINLKKLNLRFLFAAESFSETFRDYLCKKAGVNNLYLDTLNIYGTAEVGAMAFETPLAILVRRLAAKNKALFEDIFSSISKTPTLAQFNPDFVNFESQDGNILITAPSAMPLIRYAVGDSGGVISFSALAGKVKQHGINLEREMRKAGIKKHDRSPFVYVYERSDFAVSLYGITLFPEFVKEALLKSKAAEVLTQKFAMQTTFDKKEQQYLDINLEEKERVSKSARQKIQKIITETLKSRSSEFRELLHHLKGRELIKLKFWPKGHPLYFAPGTKQKWTLKNART